MTHFGSVAKLREATVEEITAVPGVGRATAQTVHDALRGATSNGASNPPSDSTPASDPDAGDTPVGNDGTVGVSEVRAESQQ